MLSCRGGKVDSREQYVARFEAQQKSGVISWDCGVEQSFSEDTDEVSFCRALCNKAAHRRAVSYEEFASIFADVHSRL